MQKTFGKATVTLDENIDVRKVQEPLPLSKLLGGGGGGGGGDGGEAGNAPGNPADNASNKEWQE